MHFWKQYYANNAIDCMQLSTNRFIVNRYMIIENFTKN
ncbi:hypothetical protein A1OE_569 [Candidatus Endolissoclinum faulkneri L2]|uniref:Uncharacterized protein n=1 Tax=Candidatus Endolissoclinum faulkneri L2 TaxID=1193729 RepID=K7YGP9_9PROT|nr:hypothetical protein A1OE_569 [Candidatus Endolissoclinum faulkneri L2]